MKKVFGLAVCMFLPTLAFANSLDEINKFAKDICGIVATKGHIESSEIKAAIEGKVNPKSLAKILGAQVSASGDLLFNRSSYEGLPYESLPRQMSDARQCRKEIAFMLLEERRKLKQQGSVVSSYQVRKNGHRLMLMKKPDFTAYNDVFNKHPLQIKLLIDGTKVELLEEKTIKYDGISLVWHRIRVMQGSNLGITGWLPQGHLSML